MHQPEESRDNVRALSTASLTKNTSLQQPDERGDKLRALIADINAQMLSPDPSQLVRPERGSVSSRASLGDAHSNNAWMKKQEEQALEIERLRATLASTKEAEENERSLRVELEQRAFEEVASATAAVGVAQAKQRQREMEMESRQNAEWRLAAAQEQLVNVKERLEIERMRRLRLQEQEVVIVDHAGESHRFFPNQVMLSDTELEHSEESDYGFNR